MEPDSELITCQRELVDFLSEAHEKIDNAHRYHKKLAKASPNRNYQVISIASECRNAWGEEQWHIENGEWGEGPDHEHFVENFAPKSQNHYHPGPFGRFMEDVFECLDVRTSQGNVVSAASALEMLQTFERQTTRS
ncbi:hypothetical protein [Roseovarius lutimaris]|uniref:hypothetical protein n=1 Tax=Roseovarius lutimaris TaxID=1005928 RepID=UPI00116083FB|nr:hypothetical protein [Roseovarius lutimaris]